MPVSPKTPAPEDSPPAAEARTRLLDCALQLFSERGFARTSTRALADAARVNLAAIRYYFGDKAGLYRATFMEHSCSRNRPPPFTDTTLALREKLQAYYANFTEPLKQGDRMQQAMRLHIREMLEPTEQWQAELDRDSELHAGLVGALCAELGLTQPDDDVHRLAISLGGLGMQLIVARDMIQNDRPALLAGPEAIDAWSQRLVDHALALVAAEKNRRAASARPSPKRGTKK